MVNNGGDGFKIKVLQVMNAEQMINIPQLGLKGKMDLILFCEMVNIKDETILKRAFLPFELKTGEREVYSYNCQVKIFRIYLIIGSVILFASNAKI